MHLLLMLAEVAAAPPPSAPEIIASTAAPIVTQVGALAALWWVLRDFRGALDRLSERFDRLLEKLK